MKTRPSLLLASAVTLAGSVSSALAATLNYSGPSGGLWNTAANWTPATIPATSDTATFTNPGSANVRLNGAASTSAHLTFGNGAGFSIGNASGDTANLAHTAARTVTVSDAFNYAINLTSGGGSGTSSTGAFLINSTTFDIIAGGKMTLDGRYFHNPGAVRTLTKSAGPTGGTGTLELAGDYTLTHLQCSLTAGRLVLNGTGTNARLLGLSSVGSSGTLVIGSSSTNLFTGTVVSPATHANTGIRLLAGLVDLNGHNLSTTRIQGTTATGVITNNGTSDAVLALGDFGADTGLATTITAPAFGGIIKDGPTHKLGLTLTGGSGDKLTLTLGQAAAHTGPTILTNGTRLITPGLGGASPITVNSGASLLVDGPLANTAGLTIADGTVEVREALSCGAVAISSGMLKTPPGVTTGIPVASLNQSGGTIDLTVVGNTADKLTSTGNMTFSGGSIQANLQSAPTAPVVLAEYGSLTGTPTVNISPALNTTRLSAPVVDSVTGNKVTLSLSGSAKDLVWTGATDTTWNLSSANWLDGASAGAFFNLDKVTFTDASASKTLDLTTTVTPGKMTFTSTGANDYVITGSGGIAGAGEGLVKSGGASLSLGGSNTFSGPVQVNDGRIVLLSPQALGFTSGMTIASGGQLDLNGQALTDAGRSFSATISGDGGDATGAIVNSSATSLLAGGTGKSGVRRLTLAANASVGGQGSFDLGTGGSINGGGFKLTKKGSGTVMINGPVTNLTTEIEAGTLSTTLDNGFGSSLLVKSGATASSSNLSTPYIHSTNVTVESDGILQSGTSVTWNGSFVAEGNLTIKIDQTTSAIMTFPNAVTIPGELLSNGAASGGSTSFLGDLTVTGSIQMTSGTLRFDGGSGSLNASSIQLSAATTVFSYNRSSTMSFSNIISGSGSVGNFGTGTLTLSGNNSYNGTTRAAAGTLLVNGIQTGTGAVTVSSGAALGGIGTLPGTMNVNAGGTLAPGNAGIGTITTGTTTINGTLRIETDGSAATPTDMLTASGPLALGTASIIDFDSTGTPLTAPVYVIATYEGALTGTFATVTDLPAGYSLVYNYDNGVTTGNIALVKAADPYAAWIATFYPGVTDPAIVGLKADPDHDGIANIIENQFGTSPGASSPGLVHVSSTGNSVIFQHTRADSPLAGYTTGYEWSADLAAWHPSGASSGGTTVTITPSVFTDNASPASDVIRVVATATSGAASSLFVRFKVAAPQ